jgi:hypothetical protein
MKSHAKITGILLSLSLCYSFLYNQQPLTHLLSQIERGRCSNISHTQDFALNTIKLNPNLSLPELNCALDILLCTDRGHNVRFPTLRTHINSIDRAISYFLETPGFHSLIIKFIRDVCDTAPHLKLWHEIKTALDIEESDTDERVVAFGIPRNYQGPSLVHFHHIITNKRWLEYKTIQWGSLEFGRGKKARNLRRQLLRQQQLVEYYNSLHETQLSYELLCTRNVSPEWHEWLAEHRIAYHIIQSLV